MWLQNSFILTGQIQVEMTSMMTLESHRLCHSDLGKDKRLKLRVLFDKTSLEIFLNDGIHVITSSIFPIHNTFKIKLFSNGARSLLIMCVVYALDDGSLTL